MQMEIDIYLPVFTILQFLFFMGLLKVNTESLDLRTRKDRDFLGSNRYQSSILDTKRVLYINKKFARSFLILSKYYRNDNFVLKISTKILMLSLNLNLLNFH